MQRCSASLVIREMQIKTVIGSYFSPARKVIIIIKNPKNITSVGEDISILEHFYVEHRIVKR